jgi:sec-independent protein translocase protein TatB
MFDIGFWEIMIITLVALLVVGPERLPTLAREIGRFVGKTRRFVNSVRSDIEQELQTEELRKMLKGQEREIQELKSMMQETEDTLRDDLRETEEALRSTDGDPAPGKKLDPEARPGAATASSKKSSPEHPEASHPQIKRVPVKHSLNADLLTDAPAPAEPSTAGSAEGTRTDSDSNTKQA